MIKEYRYYFMGFINQKHIIELNNNNLLYDYLVLFEKLSQYGGKYIHKRTMFLADLSSFANIPRDRLKTILEILKNNEIINYKYDTLYLNEPLLTYGIKNSKEYPKENNDKIVSETWDSLMKELE